MRMSGIVNLFRRCSIRGRTLDHPTFRIALPPAQALRRPLGGFEQQPFGSSKRYFAVDDNCCDVMLFSVVH